MLKMMYFADKLKKIINIYFIYFCIMLGGILRLYRVGYNSFWHDEAGEIVWMLPFKQTVLQYVKIGYPPVLYKALLYCWRHIFGNTELGVRLFSVILGLFCIFLIFKLTCYLFGLKTAKISAFLLAISPFHIYYSQEARMYTLICFLSALAVYSLHKALKKNKNLLWAGYVILNILNVYAHHIGAFMLFGQVLYFLLNIRKYQLLFKKWIKVHIIIFLLLIPWMFSIFRIFKFYTSHMDLYEQLPFYLPAVSLMSLFYTFKNFAIGYNASFPLYILAFLIFAVLFMLGLDIKQNKNNVKLSFCYIFLPIIILYIISKFNPCYVDRYFIFSSIFYLIIVSNGIARLKLKVALVIIPVIILLNVLALSNYYKNYLPGHFQEHIGVQARKEHRQASRFISDNLQKGDAVLHICQNTFLPFVFYCRNNQVLNCGRGKAVDNIFVLKENVVQVIERTDLKSFFYSVNDIPFGLFDRVWVVFSQWEFKKESTLYLTKTEIAEVLDRHLKFKARVVFEGIIIYLYTKE